MAVMGEFMQINSYYFIVHSGIQHAHLSCRGLSSGGGYCILFEGLVVKIHVNGHGLSLVLCFCPLSPPTAFEICNRDQPCRE